MRSGPAYTHPSPVIVGTATVEATGQVIPLVSISSFRSIGGAGMPSEIHGGGDSYAARAVLEVAPAGWTTGTTTRPGTPWRPEEGLPLPDGTLVTVAIGEADGGTHPVITRGVVVSESGSMKDPMVMVVEDTLDGLSGRASWSYLRSAMPPAQTAPTTYRSELRRVGLSHWSLLERAFRVSGNGTTPPDPSPNNVGLVVPLVDTAWPEKGTCYRAHSYDDSGQVVDFVTETGTRMLTSGSLVYAPSGPITGSSRYVSMRVAPGHSGPVAVTMQLTGGTVTVRVTGSRTVEVTSSAGPTQHTRAMGSTDEWVHVRFSTDGTTQIRTATVNETGSVSLGGLTGGITQVSVGAFPGARVNGLIVTGTSHADALLAWTPPTKFSSSSAIPSTLTDTPRVHDQDALQLIAEITKAACLGLWRDAQGFYRVAAPDQPAALPSRRTFTPSDMEGLNWNRLRRTARRRVVLTRKRPISGSRLVPSHLVWQGSGDTLARGHSSVEVYRVPADQDVILCTEIHKAGQPIVSTAWGNPDKGHGLIMGGWLPQSNDWATTEIACTIDADPRAGVYTFTSATVVAEMDPGDEVALVTASKDHPTTNMPQWRREQKLPQAGSWVLCTWVDDTTMSGTVGAAPNPDLEHDVGPHVQTGAQALADYLASRLVPTGPGNPGLVVLDEIPIRPDWRLEEGDVITIEDHAWMELRLVCLITEIDRGAAAGSTGMSMTVQVLSGESLAYTYGDADNFYADQAREYAELDAASTTTDYAGLSAEPLR